MQNFSLLLACGRVEPAGDAQARLRGHDRGVADVRRVHRVRRATAKIILCERGIRTFETTTRNTLDLTAVPLVHHLTHLPVIVDPSHATGKRWLVKPLAIGGVAVGADGIMVEVHPRPDEALSDAEQQLDFPMFASMMAAVTGVHDHVKDLHGDLLRAAARRGLTRDDDGQGTGQAPGGGTRRRRRSSCDPPRACGARPRSRATSRSRTGRSCSRCSRAGESTIAAAGDGEDVRSTARRRRGARGHRRADGRARRPGRLPRRVARRRRADGARGRPRLRQLRDDDAAASPGSSPAGRCSRSSTATPRSAAGRWAASPSRWRGWARGSPVAAAGRCCRSRSPAAARLRPIRYDTPVPSAQVKSAVLLAGLAADGETAVTEAVATRDHTERMLRARGVAVEETTGPGRRPHGRAWTGRCCPPRSPRPCPPTRRAPPSGWSPAAIHPDAELRLEGVSTNPTRRAIIDILRRMGASIEERRSRRPRAARDGEPLADLVVRSSELRGVDLSPADVAAAIDEIPVLGLAAAVAAGTTRFRGAGELRHKESDRIAGIADGLTALGAQVRVEGDDIEIHGGTRLTGAVTETHDDHRLAMTFAIAGLIAGGRDRRRPARVGGRSPTPASSGNSKGCGHDEARRPHRPPGGPFAVRRDAAGGLRQLGIDASYELWDRAPIALADAIAELRTDDFLGANVTIPHKERVVPQVDRLTEEAHATGAVNTLTKEGKEARRPQHRRARASRSRSTSSSAARRCRATRSCWAPAAGRGRSSTG